MIVVSGTTCKDYTHP